MAAAHESRRRRVLVVGDRRRAGVSEAVKRHRAFLEGAVDLLDVDLEDRVDLERAQADLVLVFGGDGSILHVARRLGENPLPVLGVNYGRFGYLADVEPEELEQGLERWLSGDFVVVARLRLDVGVRRAGRRSAKGLALNDVVVARNQAGQMVDVDVRIDGRLALGISGDGLIVATPTGSTAHALSAGGPILEPTVNAVVLVPIAPHSLANRACVFSSDHVIELCPEVGRGGTSLVLDGRPAAELKAGDVVEVKGSRSPLHLVQVSRATFYDALRVKLGWTGRVRPPAPGGTGPEA
jgi:NAD+ kinase